MIHDYDEFCNTLYAMMSNQPNMRKYSPEVAFICGFTAALRIAAARPDFALAYERIERAEGSKAEGTDDVNEMVAGYLNLLAIAPEVSA